MSSSLFIPSSSISSQWILVLSSSPPLESGLDQRIFYHTHHHHIRLFIVNVIVMESNGQIVLVSHANGMNIVIRQRKRIFKAIATLSFSFTQAAAFSDKSPKVHDITGSTDKHEGATAAYVPDIPSGAFGDHEKINVSSLVLYECTWSAFCFSFNSIVTKVWFSIRNSVRTQAWIKITKHFSLFVFRIPFTVPLQSGIILLYWIMMHCFLCVDDIIHSGKNCKLRTFRHTRPGGKYKAHDIGLALWYPLWQPSTTNCFSLVPHIQQPIDFFLFVHLYKPLKPKAQRWRIQIKAIGSKLTGLSCIWGFLMSSVSQESSVTDCG